MREDVKRLIDLIRGDTPCISIVTYEEHDALSVVRDTAVELGRAVNLWSIGYGVRNGLLSKSPAEPGTDNANTGLCYLAKSEQREICVTLDLAEHLHSELTRRMLRDAITRIDEHGGVLVMIDSHDKLPEVIRAYARSVTLTLPDSDELEDLIRNTLREVHEESPIEINITKRAFEAIVRNLRGLSRRQARQLILETVTDRRFTDDDVNRVLAGKRRMLQSDGLLEYIQTPLDLNEIGGMTNLKAWLEKRKACFGDQADPYGLQPPRGVLMLGVQGAGKSLCAKAIATAWSQPLLRLDPSVLYDKYIGQSEQNLQRALKQTEAMAPVILWIDEIEKGFASAAAQSNDGGLSKRMFGTLLTWMQEHTAPVFLIATANDIEALPPELLRKGRFDEIFFVDLPGPAARKMIFTIHLRKRSCDAANFDLDALVSASDGFSGAEIEQAIISALHEALSASSSPTTEMILAQLAGSPPLSVTMHERIAALRDWAKTRTVPADQPAAACRQELIE